jgi:hypothetical protein
MKTCRRSGERVTEGIGNREGETDDPSLETYLASELMRYMSSRLSSKELSEVIDTLVHANIVEMESTGGGVFYRMKE